MYNTKVLFLMSYMFWNNLLTVLNSVSGTEFGTERLRYGVNTVKGTELVRLTARNGRGREVILLTVRNSICNGTVRNLFC